MTTTTTATIDWDASKYGTLLLSDGRTVTITEEAHPSCHPDYDEWVANAEVDGTDEGLGPEELTIAWDQIDFETDQSHETCDWDKFTVYGVNRTWIAESAATTTDTESPEDSAFQSLEETVKGWETTFNEASGLGKGLSRDQRQDICILIAKYRQAEEYWSGEASIPPDTTNEEGITISSAYLHDAASDAIAYGRAVKRLRRVLCRDVRL